MANTKGAGLPLPVIADNWFRYHKRDGSHKYVAYVSTYAELKTACEDSTIEEIHFTANCTGGDTIACLSYKNIYGHGFELDWDGAANGYMFYNLTGLWITYHGIHFVTTGNTYFVRVETNCKIDNCEVDDIGNGLFMGNDCTIIDSTIACPVLTYGSHVTYTRTEITNDLYIYGGVDVTLDDVEISGGGALRFYSLPAYVDDKDFRMIGGSIVTSNSYAVYFEESGTGIVLMKNIKFIGVTFDAVDHCILLEDNAELNVEAVDFDHCVFRDTTNAVTFGANPNTSAFRFNNGRYDAITTRYNFTDPGDFTYTNDGD